MFLNLFVLMMTGLWVTALVKPSLLTDWVLGLPVQGTEKSRWVRRQLRRFGLKLYRWTGWIPIVATHFLPEFWAWGVILAVGVGTIPIPYVLKSRLLRQYELWQQLGYDGPPALDEQATKLKANPEIVSKDVVQARPTDTRVS